MNADMDDIGDDIDADPGVGVDGHDDDDDGDDDAGDDDDGDDDDVKGTTCP